jgi:dCTP deaminase
VILSNVASYEGLDQGRIILDPQPQPRYLAVGQDSPYDTHSVDVRLAKFLSIPKQGAYTFDLGRKDRSGSQLTQTLAANSRQVEIPEEGYNLEPGVFVLGQTVEQLHLPIDTPSNRALKRCIAARFEGKSSRARTGLLVHFTAPTIHPDFKGTITLEMINHGPVPFVLRAGMPIGQLIFEEVDGLPIPKHSQFQGQDRPEGKLD